MSDSLSNSAILSPSSIECSNVSRRRLAFRPQSVKVQLSYFKK